MEVSHGTKLDFEPLSLSHRGSGLSFKTLARGDEHLPENFYFSLAKQRDFFSPVHRHNFDQFRYAYKGDISLGETVILREGQLSYHPEAAYYGPQSDDASMDRIVLVLQCGGASGQGYLSFGQLGAANKELAKTGKFEGGKYHAADGTVRDGFQALWEHTQGRKLVYPEPRYNPSPIVIDPAVMKWKPCRGDDGCHGTVYGKTLGIFSERNLTAQMFRIERGGKVEVRDEDKIHLWFVLKGQGTTKCDLEGVEEDLEVESTIYSRPGRSYAIECTGEALELLHYIMPLVGDLE